MTKTELLEHLKRLGACNEASEWVESTGRMSAQRVWATCPRTDWLLWLAPRAGVNRRAVVLAACACARTALVHVPAGEDRPRLAIEAAEGWARGEVSIDDVRPAAYAAYAANAAVSDTAFAAASSAANAAAAAYADDAAYYVANAAYYADDAAEADASDASDADLVRQHITWAMVAEGLSTRLRRGEAAE